MRYFRAVDSGLPLQRAARGGNAPLQMVAILAVTLIVLLAILKLWSGSGGEDRGLRGEVQARLQSVMSGTETAGDDSPATGNPGGNGGGAGDTPQPPGPPPTLTDAERREVARLQELARILGGRANLKAMIGDEVEATRLTALADAALLAAASIQGPEHLKTEIAAIAARRTVEATANALLRAIENRIPITRFVKLPILDGLGQLTGDFVHWWREQQAAPTTPGFIVPKPITSQT